MAQSNFDRRRINGPEESFPPVFSDEEQNLASRVQTRNGRGPKEIRPICEFLLAFLALYLTRYSLEARVNEPSKWISIR